MVFNKTITLAATSLAIANAIKLESTLESQAEAEFWDDFADFIEDDVGGGFENFSDNLVQTGEETVRELENAGRETGEWLGNAGSAAINHGSNVLGYSKDGLEQELQGTIDTLNQLFSKVFKNWL